VLADKIPPIIATRNSVDFGDKYLPALFSQSAIRVIRQETLITNKGAIVFAFRSVIL
jgi:hypothetical protein